MKKPNGFEKSKGKKQKPKKADNEDDNDEEDEEDNEEEKDNDLLSNKKVEEIEKNLIETIGNTNLTVMKEAISYLEDLPIEVIKEALVRTARKQKKWDYTRGILDNWVDEKINTLEKVVAKDMEFKGKNNFVNETEEEKLARKLKELEGG